MATAAATTNTTSADADHRAAALSARAASRAFAAAPTSVRVASLENIAAGLLSRSEEILAANAGDLKAASRAGSEVEPALLQRLKLTEAKLQTLASGIRAIAAAREPLGAASSRIEVAEGLTLEKTACPIGVLLVIFESRPDALPQIAALAIRSGNGLLLKGGKEASKSNAVLHQVVVDAVAKATTEADPEVNAEGLISLVTSRAGVSDLLKLDDVIDLVIPRGGNALVTHVQSSTRIPVLGHADGVCHIYVDKGFSVGKALPIVLDSKLDYPAACNAVETLLVHSSFASSSSSPSSSPPDEGEGTELEKLVEGLQKGGVTVRAWRSEDGKVVGGARKSEEGEEKAFELLSSLPAAPARRHEYGSPDLTIEIVPSTAGELVFFSGRGRVVEGGRKERKECARKRTKKMNKNSLSIFLSQKKKKSRRLPRPRPRQRPHRRHPLGKRRGRFRIRQLGGLGVRLLQRVDALRRRVPLRPRSRGRDQHLEDPRARACGRGGPVDDQVEAGGEGSRGFQGQRGGVYAQGAFAVKKKERRESAEMKN